MKCTVGLHHLLLFAVGNETKRIISKAHRSGGFVSTGSMQKGMNGNPLRNCVCVVVALNLNNKEDSIGSPFCLVTLMVRKLWQRRMRQRGSCVLLKPEFWEPWEDWFLQVYLHKEIDGTSGMRNLWSRFFSVTCFLAVQLSSGTGLAGWLCVPFCNVLMQILTFNVVRNFCKNLPSSHEQEKRYAIGEIAIYSYLI